MHINKKIILGIIIVIFLAIGIIFISPIFFNNPEKTIISEFDNSTLFTNDKTKFKGGFSGFIKGNYYVKHTVVMSHFDINNPIFTLIVDNKDDVSTDLFVFQFSRYSFTTMKIDSYIQASIKYTADFDKTVSIAQKYDLSKENPDPQNITVFTPLQPSSSSETVVYPQGVTVPYQGGVETK